MAITTTWTAPTTAVTSGGLDFATGNTIDEATLDRLVSNINRLGGADGDTKTGIYKLAKGADIASAATVALGTDGNAFDITGTTTITSITALAAGTTVFLQFDGALKVTHGTGANNPKLREGQDFYTQAGAWLLLVSDGTNFWEIARRFSATAAHGRVSSNLGGDVTMTTAGTEYDGPSVSLVAGVWHVTAHLTHVASTTASCTTRAQLWDGTTVFASGSFTSLTASYDASIPLDAIVVLTATATVKLSAKSSGNAAKISAAGSYAGVGNFATGIHATRIY